MPKTCEYDECNNEKTLGSGVRYCAEHRVLTAYSTRHKMVQRTRGSAAEYTCVKCAERNVIKKAHDWATVHDTNGADPHTDYIPLCVPCHTTYDQRNIAVSIALTGRTLSPEAIKRLKQPWSASRRAKYEEGTKVRGAKKCNPECTCGRHSAATKVKQSKAKKGSVPWNKGGTIIGPDGRRMSRGAYEADVGQLCEI